MCYRLRREIVTLFPPGTTPAERLLGLEIADLARTTTRIAVINPMDILYERTGLDKRGVRDALTTLKRRGLEFRVILATGHDGRAVYSYRGRPPEFRVPFPDEFRDAWEGCGAMLASLSPLPP
jgi:hypothetical protein